MLPSTSIIVDGVIKANVVHDLRGIDVDGRLATADDDELIAEFAQPEILPGLSKERLEEAYQQQLKALEVKGLTDGPTISPVAYVKDDDGSAITYILRKSTYGRHLAAVECFTQLGSDDRMMQLRSTSLGTKQSLSNTAGVNGTIVTGDGVLILGVRGNVRGVGTERGTLATTFSQGTRLTDLHDDGSWSPYDTAALGSLQELNLLLDDEDVDFRLHSFVVQDDGGLCWLGHGTTGRTASEIFDGHKQAQDKWEHKELIGVEFSPEGVMSLTVSEQPKANWFGPAIIGAMESSRELFEPHQVQQFQTSLAQGGIGRGRQL